MRKLLKNRKAAFAIGALVVLGSFLLMGHSRVKKLIMLSTAAVRGTLTVSGVTTHGGNVVSDTDGTDNLGTPTVRWNALYVDELFSNKGDTVASATQGFTLGADGNYYVVSGTAVIDSIAIQTVGKFIFLQTAAACTLSDGGNLKLAGDFNATADDVILLISDGTNWHEVSRSAN